MKRSETTNSFQDGLIMDLNPLTTPNSVMTNALNATLITYNGNENVLLNDMGNGRVETAKLPEGYIPLGTAELGGIIFIASYNPLTGKSLIGSFPSPERNVTSDELGLENPKLDCTSFYDANDSDAVVTDTIKLELTNDSNLLRAGDKFCICSNSVNNEDDELSAYGTDNINKSPKWLKLHVVSIQDDGKLVYLDDDLTWYNNKNGTYYIKLGTVSKNADGKLDLDEYRDVVESNYSVFSSKVPGKLGIVALLEAVLSFSASANITSDDSDWLISFNTNWTYSNPIKESRESINPIGIKCSQSKDTLSFVSLSKRNNDGSDKDVITELIMFGKSNKDVKTFKLYPEMSYGYLKYLEASIDIDFSKLGNGETTLNEYRYYCDDELLTLSYGFDSYPEEGSTVNSVTFNFYPLNQNNYDVIKEDAKLKNDMLYDPIVLSKEYSKSALNLNSEIKYLFVKKSDSFLGHFTEGIYWDKAEKTGLQKDYCYIVEIIIDYSGTPRYYYRILYTNKIFNKAYYTANDFSELVLENYVNPTFYIEDNNNTTLSSERSYFDYFTNDDDEDAYKLLEIPSTSDSKDAKYYIIEDTFKDLFDLTLAGKVDDLFKVSINKITNPTDWTYKVDTNTKKIYTSYTSESDKLTISTRDISRNLSLGVKEDKGTIKFVYSYDIYHPIEVTYDNINYQSVKYELSKLNGDIYYLSTYGRDRELRLGLDNFRTNPVDCPYTTAGGDDDELTYNSMKQVPEIGPGIKDILCNYDKDWIAIIVNIFYNKNGEIYFYMSTSSDDNQYGYHANKDEVKRESVSTCFVLFALKNESNYAIIGIAGGSFGQTVKPSYTSGRKISSEFPQLSNIEDSSTITDIKAKFSNIYKLSEYTGNGKEVNTYSNIVYWNNYTANCNLDIPIETVGYQLKVNDIALLTNSEINNFKYTGITKYEVKSSISHYINFDKVVLTIMNASLSSNNYIYYESDNGSGQFVYINSYDRRNLYTISDVNGVTTLNIYSKLFNKLPISNQNGTDVTVKTSNITSDTTQYIKIKQEEESYTIKNIYTV